jgi:hypothetical protein
MCYWVAKCLLDAAAGDLTFGDQTLRTRCLLQVIHSPECQYLRDYANHLGAFDGVPERWKSSVWAAMFDEAVFLATMYHDIGYPWQFVQAVANQLSDHTPLPMTPMQMEVHELYAAYGARLFCYPFQGYNAPSATQPLAWRQRTEKLLASGFAQTHGLPGALAFLYLNDILRDYPESPTAHARGVFCLEWAALAILMHDLQKLYWGNGDAGPPPENPQLRVRFQRDPLSFVLTLVDQIEDFCRPNSRFTPRPDLAEIRYDHTCRAVEVTSLARRL